MKKCFVLLLLLPGLIMMAGCQEAPEPQMNIPLMEAARQALGEAEAFVSYPAEDLYELTGISPDDYTEAVFLRDRDTLSGREAIMIRTKDANSFQNVKEALERYLSQRLKETRDYLPNVYQLLCDAKVQGSGLTVSLIIQ